MFENADELYMKVKVYKERVGNRVSEQMQKKTTKDHGFFYQTGYISRVSLVFLARSRCRDFFILPTMLSVELKITLSQL